MGNAVYRFNSSLVMREMDQIKTWLSRAGLDPKNVPIEAKVVLGDDTMTIDVYLVNENGAKYVIGETIARGTVTVPLLMPPKLLSLVAIPAEQPGGTT